MRNTKLFLFAILGLTMLLGQGQDRSSQPFSGQYKSYISITGSNNDTLKPTLQQLQDGKGNLLPIYVADDSTKITGVVILDSLNLTSANIDKLNKDLDANGYYILNEQGRQDHVSNTMPSPYYRFDGVDDYIDLPGLEGADYETADKGYVEVILSTTNFDTQQAIFSCGTAVGKTRIRMPEINSSGQLYFDCEINNSNKWRATSTKTLTINTVYHVFIVQDGVEPKLYINGKEDDLVFSITTDKTVWFSADTDINEINIGAHKSGGDARALFFEGEIYKVRVGNNVLTAAEVKALYADESVDFKHKKASQTEMLTDGGFETWASATNLTNWTEYTEGTSSVNRESTVINSGTYAVRFDIDGSASSVGIYDPNALGALTPGKSYRITYWAKASTTGKSIGIRTATSGVASSTVHATQAITTTYTKYNTEFVCPTSHNNIIFFRDAVSGSSYSVYIDDASLVDIGAVAEYDGSSTGHNQWQDKSGNALHGTVSGATLENTGLPHSELYTRDGTLEVSGETTLTNIIPAGYEVASIAYKNTTANAITSFDVGFTDGGGEVVAATAIGASAVGTLSISQGLTDMDNDDTLYLSASAWNAGSLELYFTLRRIK